MKRSVPAICCAALLAAAAPPAWFPDGKRIAFQSTRTGRTEIWVMNDDGTKLRQVTK